MSFEHLKNTYKIILILFGLIMIKDLWKMQQNNTTVDGRLAKVAIVVVVIIIAQISQYIVLFLSKQFINSRLVLI